MSQRYLLISAAVALALIGVAAAQQFSYSIPLSASVSNSGQSITLGQTASISVFISGGSAPYTVRAMLGGTTSIGSGTVASEYNLQFTPSQPGSYTIEFYVTDASGVETTATASVQVGSNGSEFPGYGESQQMIVSASPTQTATDAGQSASITVIAQGGTPPYTITSYVNGGFYQSFNTGSGVSETAPYTFTYTPSVAGPYDISFVVSDSAGNTKTASAIITANPGQFGGLGRLQVSASTSPSTVQAGSTTQLSIMLSGGVPPYTVNIYSEDGSQLISYPLQTSAYPYTYTYTVPSATGQYSLSVIVKDSAGNFATAYPHVTTTGASVSSGFAGGVLSATISPSTATVPVGQSVQLTVTPTGGTTPYYVVVYVDGVATVGAVATSTYTYQFTPTIPGIDTITISVESHDGLQTKTVASTITAQNSGSGSSSGGSSSSGSATSSSTPVTVSTSPTPSSSVSVGQNVQIPISISGGTPPYTITVYGSSQGQIVASSTGSSYTYSFTPAAAGTYIFSVIVKDSAGTYGTSYPKVTATGSSGSSSSSTTPLSVSASGSSVSVGQNVQIPISISGGTPPYTIKVYGSSQGQIVGSSTGSSYNYGFTPTVAGSYIFTVVAEDSSGTFATSYPKIVAS